MYRDMLRSRELSDRIERTYVAQGGTNVIHYLGVTPMHAPSAARLLPSTNG